MEDVKYSPSANSTNAFQMNKCDYEEKIPLRENDVPTDTIQKTIDLHGFISRMAKTLTLK